MTDLPDLSEEAMLVALPETNTAESAKSDHTSHSAQLGKLGEAGFVCPVPLPLLSKLLSKRGVFP